jgi:hypothetical protein
LTFQCHAAAIATKVKPELSSSLRAVWIRSHRGRSWRRRAGSPVLLVPRKTARLIGVFSASVIASITVKPIAAASVSGETPPCSAAAEAK